MSCRGNHKTENCVCDVVRAIADAQTDVIENECDVSCAKSIENLLEPIERNELDTVPFILYCDGDCQPFKGFGTNIESTEEGPIFNSVESFIFRVKEVDEDCCAVLELLSTGEDADTPCDQLNGVNVENLTKTGICITVDLDCFCGITCLPAVSLL